MQSAGHPRAIVASLYAPHSLDLLELSNGLLHHLTHLELIFEEHARVEQERLEHSAHALAPLA
jgi:hypothetical protein